MIFTNMPTNWPKPLKVINKGEKPLNNLFLGGGFCTESIFDKKGNVKLEVFKSSVEDFFIGVVSEAKKYITDEAEDG